MEVEQLSEIDIWQHWIETEDIASIETYLYSDSDIRLNEKQCDMIADIIFRGWTRVLWNTFTRFGKSLTASRLIGIYIYLNMNKIVNVIGPQKSQAMIIMNYFIKDAFENSPILRELFILTGSRDEKIGKETSKSKYTLRNGCVVRAFGVHGEGKGAMGEGGDLNISDELGLIEPATYRTKVQRLLGDNYESSINLGLFNPWSRDTQAADLWFSGRYKCVHVGWREGITLGRISQEYVDEQKETLTETEFMVLYESIFPKNTIDTIIPEEKLQAALVRKLKIHGRPHIEIGVDVARFGKDETVIAARIGMKCWYLKRYNKEDTMQTAGRVSTLIRKFIDEGYEVIVNIDDTGLGGGVTDRLRELHDDEAEINGIINNSKSNNPRYANRITELWFWLRDNIDLISLPKDSRLVKDFSKRKYKVHSDRSLILESKDDMKKRGLRSPDVADAIANAFASETEGNWDSPIGGFA